jgi:hypothetical protein
MNIMCHRITIAALALVFTCSTLAAAKYDPDKWLKPAKEAGFTYAVLTTRHHEGFALWPSKYGDFDVVEIGLGQQSLSQPPAR